MEVINCNQNMVKLFFKQIEWGLGIWDWELGIEDWAQSPIPIHI
jgi:hypothetical protein